MRPPSWRVASASRLYPLCSTLAVYLPSFFVLGYVYVRGTNTAVHSMKVFGVLLMASGEYVTVRLYCISSLIAPYWSVASSRAPLFPSMSSLLSFALASATSSSTYPSLRLRLGCVVNGMVATNLLLNAS